MKESSVRQCRLIILPCALLLSLLNLADVLVIDHRKRVRTGKGRKLYATQQEQHPTVQEQGPTIDVVSIGSLLKQEYQDAQERTFGSAAVVRNFFRITERNDTDSTCFTELTSDQLDRVIDFCSQTDHQSFISQTIRERLFQPKKHTGWMCAQKRPLDGLYQVLQRYMRGEETIPDYLIISDDDTFLNLDRLTPDLLNNYPTNHSHAVAGCNFNFLKHSGITFPYGGFGTFLTKAAIARLIQPFYCDGRDEHSKLACWRLKINALGEKQFYVEGMSVLDLMQAYGAQLKFTDVETWTDTGYCLHSDHALAYFINFYHITVPQGTVAQHETPTDKIRREYGFVGFAGEKECQHERDHCSAENRICHYTTPEQMDQLFAEQQHKKQVFATSRT